MSSVSYYYKILRETDFSVFACKACSVRLLVCHDKIGFYRKRFNVENNQSRYYVNVILKLFYDCLGSVS